MYLLKNSVTNSAFHHVGWNRKEGTIGPQNNLEETSWTKYRRNQYARPHTSETWEVWKKITWNGVMAKYEWWDIKMQEKFTLKRKFMQVGTFKIWLSVCSICSIVINLAENQKLGCSALQKEHNEHVLCNHAKFLLFHFLHQFQSQWFEY